MAGEGSEPVGCLLDEGFLDVLGCGEGGEGEGEGAGEMHLCGSDFWDNWCWIWL